MHDARLVSPGYATATSNQYRPKGTAGHNRPAMIDGMTKGRLAVRPAPVGTVAEARRLRFPGSLTVRIDGLELVPIEGQADGTSSCRIYRTPEGLMGSPTHAIIVAALESATARPAPRA